MLRIAVLIVYLTHLIFTGQLKSGGGLDPDGKPSSPPPTKVESGGGLDPNGLTDTGGGLDPLGLS
jgi:hypothetical protein